MRLLLKWSDGCGVQYVQREAALGTAALYGDIEALAKEMAIDEAVKFGVIGTHVVFEPHCFKYIHDAVSQCDQTQGVSTFIASYPAPMHVNDWLSPRIRFSHCRRARSSWTIRTRA